MPNQPYKAFDGGVSSGLWILCNGLQVIPARPDAFRGDTMSQVFNFFLERGTIGGLKFQSMEVESLHHGL